MVKYETTIRVLSIVSKIQKKSLMEEKVRKTVNSNQQNGPNELYERSCKSTRDAEEGDGVEMTERLPYEIVTGATVLNQSVEQQIVHEDMRPN